MNGWKKIYLGELISIKGGFSYKGNHIGTGSSYLLGMGCVSFNDKFIYSGARAYSGDCSESYLVKPGDLVLATRQQSDNLPILGLPAIVPEDFKGKKVIAGTNLYMIKNNSEVDNKFLYWLLKTDSYSNHILACSKGTTVRMITKDAIESFEFSCPPKKERDEITEILWSLENKIDLLKRQNITLKQIVESLFRQWFLKELEESWKTVKISDVASINKHNVGRDHTFEEIEYLDTGSITNGQIESFQKYPFNDAPSRAQRLVGENDIVYSLVRPIQRHFGLLYDVKNNTIVSTGFSVISCESISPYFIYTLLTLNETVEYFDMIAEGSTSTYPSLKPSDIANFEFQLPPLGKLEEFSEIAENSWSKIKANKRQINTLILLRDTMLPKLMNGEVTMRI